MMGKLLIGTSGWSYRDWVGPFYPKGLSSTRWFSHYCQHFQTVELNVTFYRIPTAQAVENWRGTSPRDFAFAIKMNRQITHIRRLVNAEDALARFNAMTRSFGPKLKVILIQLPPTLAYDAGVAREFFSRLRRADPNHSYALEVRHPSWFTQAVYDLLDQHGIAFCVADVGGHFPSQEILTAPFVYVRFHGPAARYASKYSDVELAAAAEKIRAWLPQRDVYAYFNNDMYGYGVENAFRLKEILSPQRVEQAA